MTEREIVRKDGKPVMFASESIQYLETGHKKNPQLYTPSCKIHKGKCRKLHVK